MMIDDWPGCQPHASGSGYGDSGSGADSLELRETQQLPPSRSLEPDVQVVLCELFVVACGSSKVAYGSFSHRRKIPSGDKSGIDNWQVPIKRIKCGDRKKVRTGTT